MPIDSKHPQYIEKIEDWTLVDDVYEGASRIKKKGTIYLPATPGMLADGMESKQRGYQAYQDYLTRAYFHGYFADAIKSLVGIVHQKPWRIKVPARMEPLVNNATSEGESLHMLARRITEAQLRDGRLGLLLEVPSGESIQSVLPYIAFYRAGAIINWDVGIRKQGRDKLELVILDESSAERQANLEWEEKDRFRALMMSNQVRTIQSLDQTKPAEGVYQVATFDSKTAEISAGQFLTPSIGGKPLTEIPFVFVNSNDLVAEPSLPPLLNLAHLDLAIYRGEADHRQSLFNQGQETLVIIGVDTDAEGQPKDQRVGAGAIIYLPEGGDAKYVGVEAKGLAEQRHALENDRDLAQQQGSRMLSTKGGDQQSGDALRTRVAAQMATLPNIARAGAEALKTILQHAATWLGENPDTVEVEANTKFGETPMTGQNLLQLQQAKKLGAPISERSIHNLLREQSMTSMTYENEMELVEEERDQMMEADPIKGDPTKGGASGGMRGVQASLTGEPPEADPNPKPGD